MATIEHFGRRALALLGAASLIVGVYGCSGDTDGGDTGSENFDGSSFVDTDSATGSITLNVLDTDLAVSETSHFGVTVRDKNGAPVPNIEIACDTETGLGLIEPSTGFELTDGNGTMSGVVGCELPGSYRMGCRLPMGANKRALVSLHCAGPVPDGFSGFPGAGGGTLGTGNSPSGDSINAGTVRVMSITGVENGADTNSFDVYRGDCGKIDQDGDDLTTCLCDLDPEPFTDSMVKVSVFNGTLEAINFVKFTYSILDSDGAGTPFTSTELAFSNGGEIKPNESRDLQALFLRAVGGAHACSSLGIGMRKVFTGKTSGIPTDLGFRNVTFRLISRLTNGEEIEISGRAGFAFANYDSCSG